MVKSWYKKLMAAVIAGSMVLGMAACGQKDTAPTAGTEQTELSAASVEETTALADYVNMDSYLPICKEPITITVTGDEQASNWAESDIVKYIGEEMGIQFDCNPFKSDAWKTQFNLIMASGELPDMMMRVIVDIAEINKYGKDGYFLPLNEYLDYMPAFKAFLEAHPDYASVITADDGNIYGLTQYDENEVNMLTRSFINQVWLDNLGLEVPKTVDELYNVLKAFKEQDANGNGDPNDEIPLSGNYTSLLQLMHAFGIFSNDMTYSPVVDADGKVSLGQASDNYKAMLQFLHKLYEEGLYDKDGLVQTNDELNAKFAEDRIGCFTTGSAPYVHAKQDITYDLNWAYMDGLTSDYNDVPAAVYKSGVSNLVRIVVSADTKYPEAICRWIDWLYTDEGAIMASNGVEGIGYAYEDVDFLPGVKVIVTQNPDPANYASAEQYRYMKSVCNVAMNVRTPYVSSWAQIMTELTDDQLKIDGVREKNGWSCLLEEGRRSLTRVDAFPVLVYTGDEAARRSTIMTDVKMYLEQSFGQFVTGELDIDANWDTYLKTLNETGLEELMAIEQAAYDRR